jgi:hypothetical protein
VARLVAEIQVWTGQRWTTRLAASDAVTFRSGWDLGPGVLALVSAVLGFVAGFVTTLAQGYLERRAKAKGYRQEAALLIAKHVLPDLRENLDRLDAFLDGSGDLSYLQTGAYQAIKDREGVFSIFKPREREAYMSKLTGLNQEFVRFNKLVSAKQVVQARTVASEITNQIRGLIVEVRQPVFPAQPAEHLPEG